MLNFSRLSNNFTNWLLFNCRTQLIISSGPIVIVSCGGRGDKYDFSNKTSPVFNLTTFLECNKLEVFLEG